MPTYAERRLASNLGNLLLTLGENVRPSADQSMSRSAAIKFNLQDLLRNWGSFFGAQTVVNNAGPIASALGVGGVAAAALAPITLRRMWDAIQREATGDKDIGKPLPYRDVRREGPRSHDKWWQRDKPTEIGEVSPSFYLETPDYEPWYQQQQAANTALTKQNLGGLPATYQTMPGYLFKPQEARSQYPITPNDPFETYDARTSRVPTASSDGDRVVQAASFETNPRSTPSLNHPLGFAITPDSEESAASMLMYEGNYDPASRTSPFVDPRFGRTDVTAWGVGGNPMERDILRNQALMGQQYQGMGMNLHWVLRQNLMQLQGGQISQDQAAKNIYGYLDMLTMQGIPREDAERAMMQALQSAQMPSGPNQTTPDVSGVAVPMPEDANWQQMHSPMETSQDQAMLEYLESQRERMKSMSPGFGSPLQAYTAGGQMAGGVV